MHLSTHPYSTQLVHFSKLCTLLQHELSFTRKTFSKLSFEVQYLNSFLHFCPTLSTSTKKVLLQVVDVITLTPLRYNFVHFNEKKVLLQVDDVITLTPLWHNFVHFNDKVLLQLDDVINLKARFNDLNEVNTRYNLNSIKTASEVI